MNHFLDKKSIIKKTAEVGGSTLLSRGFGLLREILKARYLGAGALADAFAVAFMIPNSLRKIFAEGALTAAFVPTIVSIVKNDDRREANALMTTAFIFFEGILAVLCILMFFNAHALVGLVAAGFDQEKIALTAKLFKILCPFILFVSSSSLLAGALQSVGHFLIPAMGPVLLNIIFIVAVSVSLYLDLPVNYLCYAILFSGIASFGLHLFAYFKYGFSFSQITPQARSELKGLIKKFVPVMFSMSIMEINLFIDARFSTYLSDGSVAIINYASRFMGIPLGVFAVAFSTILLPHFARVRQQEPEKLSFYLFEASKLVMWVTIPVMIFMMAFSQEIFTTMFLSDKFPMEKIMQAKLVLIAFLAGLFFFSLNKIILNIYYVLHDTFTPMAISIVATLANLFLNRVFVSWLKAPGLAIATSLSGVLQMALFIYFLRTMYNFDFHFKHGFDFFIRFVLQTFLISMMFIFSYLLFKNIILLSFSSMPKLQNFLICELGLWLWVGPLFMAHLLAFFKTRKYFGLKLYFLD